MAGAGQRSNAATPLSCDQARLLMRYGAAPGTLRRGIPELGFHLAICAACREQWQHRQRVAEPQASGANVVYLAEIAPAAALPVPPLQVLGTAPLDETGSDPAPAAMSAPMPCGAATTGDVAAADPPPEPRVSYATLLRNTNFRLLWLGQAISTLGSYFTRVVIPIYVYDLTQSYAHLGFSAFSSLIASLLFGLVAGALVDRWDRRRTMIVVDLLNALLLTGLLMMALMPLAVPVKLVGLYAINFLTALLRELFTPARIAILTDVVAEDELLAANSLDQATSSFSELLSYPLAGIVLMTFGPALAFGIDALTFVASAGLLLGVRVPRATQPREVGRPLIGEIVAGLRIINQLPLVRMVVLLSLVVPLLISWYNTLQLPFVVEALYSSKELGFPVMEGSVTLGFALGVLALGWWGQQLARNRLIVLGIIGLGVMIVLQGLVPLLGAAYQDAALWPGLSLLLLMTLPCTLGVGAANSVVFTGVRTVVQEQTPRAALGRVASVVSVASGVGFAVGALLTGLAAGRVALVICLIGVMITTIGLISHAIFGRYQALHRPEPAAQSPSPAGE